MTPPVFFFALGVFVGGGLVVAIELFFRARFLRRVGAHVKRELEPVQCPKCAIMTSRYELASSHKCPPFIDAGRGNPIVQGSKGRP